MDRQTEAVPNLPQLSIIELSDAISAASEDGSTISLVSSSSDEGIVGCISGEEAQPAINIINSSDVVVGTVTQFHGPVTIVQQIPGSENEQQSITSGESKKAKLVTADTIEPVKTQVRCFPKKLVFFFSSVTLMILIIVSVLIFSITPNGRNDTGGEGEDLEPEDFTQEYNITGHKYYTRAQWGGRAPMWVDSIEGQVYWVIISHTVTSQCTTFGECSNQMRLMQDMHVNDGSPNIGYNFVVGGDANVYEGRGWFVQNFHRFERNSMAISFTGNYVYDELTTDMVDVFLKLLNLGVDLKILHPNYRLIAHNQTLVTLSPGVNIYKVLKNMPNFYIDLRPRKADED